VLCRVTLKIRIDPDFVVGRIVPHDKSSLFATLSKWAFRAPTGALLNRNWKQGCQIFLGTKYQNGKKYFK
jgi:hypothetical protein